MKTLIEMMVCVPVEYTKEINEKGVLLQKFCSSAGFDTIRLVGNEYLVAYSLVGVQHQRMRVLALEAHEVTYKAGSKRKETAYTTIKAAKPGELVPVFSDALEYMGDFVWIGNGRVAQVSGGLISAIFCTEGGYKVFRNIFPTFQDAVRFARLIECGMGDKRAAQLVAADAK